jgi:hypothetical protein
MKYHLFSVIDPTSTGMEKQYYCYFHKTLYVESLQEAEEALQKHMKYYFDNKHRDKAFLIISDVLLARGNFPQVSDIGKVFMINDSDCLLYTALDIRKDIYKESYPFLEVGGVYRHKGSGGFYRVEEYLNQNYNLLHPLSVLYRNVDNEQGFCRTTETFTPDKFERLW